MPRPLDALRADRAPRPTLVALVLLVTVPIGAISALAWRIVSDEQRAAKIRFEDLVGARLEDVRLGLEQRTLELGQDLARDVVRAERTPDSLRQLRRQMPLARELFVLSASGKLIFPPAKGASGDERAFRQRTAAIWDGAATLYEPPQDEEGQAPREAKPISSGPRLRREGEAKSFAATRGLLDRLSTVGQGQGDSLVALAARRPEGWLSWYWQDGLHLLFWRRAADGAVIGAEVDRVVLLSRLLATLPDRTPVPGRVLLVDAKGDRLHGWGPYRPSSGIRPDSTRNLAYPLEAWRLQYFVDPAAAEDVYGGSVALGAGLGVAAVALALVLLAAWLWRSSTRAMREARQRVSFVTQVSHELKTPLANIRLYAELLEDDLVEADDSGPIRRLGVIVSESQRLSRLIGNILTFTKQQRGDAPKPAEPVSVDPSIRRTIDQFRPALAAKDVAIALQLGAPLAAVAEADGLEQVLANLVGNVEKYASSGRWLGVRSSQDELHTRIEVEDRGPGIPKRQAERVFEPFYRVSDRLDDGVTGTGIGLAIARTLVHTWGGRLEHQVPEGGCGARFVIELSTAASRKEITG